MSGIHAEYSHFYKGTQQIKGYGSGNGQKDAVVHYQFDTTDKDGNQVMDKMSREETYRTMNKISAGYGNNVIVEFSGDGLTALEEHQGKIPLPEDHREIPEDMITYLEGPKPLSEEELAEMEKGQYGDDTEALMKAYDPKAYEEMQKIKEEGRAAGTQEGMVVGFRYMWKWMTNQAQTDPGWVEKAKNGQQAVKKEPVLTNFRYEFGSRMSSIYGEKDANGEYSTRNYFSVSDAANNMLKAYATMYDEIVKGYEDGTRETYMKDASAEGGYRKLTMDEELDELDKAYKDYADRYASHRDKNVIGILSAYAKQLSRIGGGRTDVANEANELLEKYKKNPVPEDFSDKMRTVADAFVLQYKANRGMDIDSLLSGSVIL